MANALLEFKNVRTWFETDAGTVKAVDGVDISLQARRTIGVVGESGCGKTVLSLTTLGLLPSPPAVVTGEILFRRDNSVIDLVSLPRDGDVMRSIRGKEIAMIFQEPMTALNPVYTIGQQITEVVALHQGLSRKSAWQRAIELLNLVEIPEPEQRLREYPHTLSGGMRQRAMIAMAIACNPRVLIADEPTTALDVTIQAQILALMKKLQEQLGTAIMLITHDLGIIAGMAHEVVVMYLGQVVERGEAREIFARHCHPYTDGLLKSIPVIGMERERSLSPIRGMVPEPLHLAAGCRFKDRCDHCFARCGEAPPLFRLSDTHQVRCWLHESRG